LRPDRGEHQLGVFNSLAIHGPQLLEEANGPLRTLFQLSFEGAQDEPVSTDAQRPRPPIDGLQ
jgi:hypothetical protein